MRITSCPNSCKRCFVTIPSAIPVVEAYNSASAKLELTVCCVRDHAVSVALPHCTTPPLVLLHVVAWPAQSLSVCTFTNFGGVTISIRLFALGTPFQVSHNTLQIHLATLGRTCNFRRAVSFTLCMTSARSWHMYNNFPTTVLCIARLSLSSSTSDSVVGVLFTLGVVTGFAPSKPRTVVTSRMYFGFASTEYPRAVRSITQPKKKIWSPSFSIRSMILIKTCFCRSSTNFKTSLLGPNSKPSST